MTVAPALRSGGGNPALWLPSIWLARILVAAIFLYAAGMKIVAPDQFAMDIRSYQLFPFQITNAMAYIVPWIEVLTAVALLIGLWRGAARLLLLFMLVAFTALKAYVLVVGLNVDCGCFGDSLLAEMSQGWNGVWLNLILIAAIGLETLGVTRLRRPATAPVASDASTPAPAVET